jgi:hypothetical protein
MTRAPTPAAIHAVELRVEQSRRDFHDSLQRAQATLRGNLSRPSTLIVAAGAAGLVIFWLAGRSRRRAPSTATVAGTSSAVGLVGGLLLNYATRHWRFIADQLLRALKQRQSRRRPGGPKPPAPVRPATRTLH